MMTRKHLVSLCAAATLTLSACSLDDLSAARRLVNVDSLVRAVATTSPVELDPTTTPPPPDYTTAALVKLRSRIRVGIRFDAPPLTRVNEQGELEGFDVDLAREFARRWLGSERNVEFVQVTSGSAPEKVRAREVDLAMGGLVKSRLAEQSVDYSLSYLVDGEALLIRSGTYSDFVSMQGQPIAYIDDGATFALRDAQNANGITITARPAGAYVEGYNALGQARVEGMVGRWRRLRTRAASDPGLQVLTVFRREWVAVMVPPDDSDWANLVDTTLSQIMADGTYAALYQKWFGGAPADLTPFTPLSGPPSQVQLAQLPDRLVPNVERLGNIRATGRLRVAYTPQNPPFSRLEENNVPGGYEVDLARAVALRVMGNAEQVEFVPLAGDPVALLQSDVDMVVGGYIMNEALGRGVTFASPTFRAAGAPAPTAMLLPRNASTLRDAVNLALQQMQADGSYAEIWARYFPDVAPYPIDVWR
jgi:aspartate/glutamate/glutamine transport system substrate-binding protein